MIQKNIYDRKDTNLIQILKCVISNFQSFANTEQACYVLVFLSPFKYVLVSINSFVDFQCQSQKGGSSRTRAYNTLTDILISQELGKHEISFK